MKKKYSILFTLLFVLGGFIVNAQIMPPSICMVSVDDSSKHNLIYYDKTSFGVSDSVILWRQNPYTGAYNRVKANAQPAFSMFIDMDTAGDPNKRLHMYKLQRWTPVGGYTQLGPYHSVLYCLQNAANYAWNFYTVEGTGSGMVAKYFLLRDNNSTNAWFAIDSVSGSTNTTTDPNVSLYPNGQWRLVTRWSITCNPLAKAEPNGALTAIVKSKSNITNNKITGINQLNPTSFTFFPNPAIEQVTLRMNFPLSEITNVKIYNTLGMEVITAVLQAGKHEIVIPVTGLAKGIYFAEISNTQNKVTKRLAVD